MKSLRGCRRTDPWGSTQRQWGLEEEPAETKRAWSAKQARTKEEWYPTLQTGGRSVLDIRERPAVSSDADGSSKMGTWN